MTWQPAAIVPPDGEALLVAAYPTLLAAHGQSGVPVSRAVPNPRPPSKCLVINRDGGSLGSNLRDSGRYRFRAFGATRDEAFALAQKVAAVAPLVPGASRVAHLSGPLEVADESGKPMQYLLIQFDFRGAALT